MLLHHSGRYNGLSYGKQSKFNFFSLNLILKKMNLKVRVDFLNLEKI